MKLQNNLTLQYCPQNQINFISPSYLCESSAFHLEIFVDGVAVLIKIYFLTLLLAHLLLHQAPLFTSIYRASLCIKVLCKSLDWQIIRACPFNLHLFFSHGDYRSGISRKQPGTVQCHTHQVPAASSMATCPSQLYLSAKPWCIQENIFMKWQNTLRWKEERTNEMRSSRENTKVSGKRCSMVKKAHPEV